MKQQVKKLYKIGVTGGIASGKTKLITYLGSIPRVFAINLDLYGHDIYAHNPIVLRNLGNIYGKDVLNYDVHQEIASVSREKLGEKVFKSDQNVRILRSIVSPEIKRLLREKIKEIEYLHSDKYDVVAVEGAVLIEARTYTMFDELWVTTLPKDQAVPRILKRNPNLTEALARDRINRQITDEERIKLASFHYDTSDARTFEMNKVLIDNKLNELRDKGLLKL